MNARCGVTTNQYVKLGFLYLVYNWLTVACITYSDNPENTVFIITLHFVLVAAQIGFSVIAAFKSIAELYEEMK
jgi:hypothetical protein